MTTVTVFCNKGFKVMKDKNSDILANETPVPDLMTEQELVQFLRIPEVSKASNYSNVVKNLIRMRDLPRIELCNKLLFPRQAILEWVENETIRK